MRQAAEWVAKTVAGWGLVNVHQEKWPFGKGWSLVRFSANMIEPQVQPLIGVPRSWTPGTSGPVTADVVRVDIRSDADFDKYRGKLAGKIVLTQPVRDVRMLEGIVVQRWNEALPSNHELGAPFRKPVLSELLIRRQAQDERRVEGLRTSGV
jgi:hypothetical protein